MKLVDRILQRFGYHKRNYDAANTGRLFSNWTAGLTSADAEIRNSLLLLRARARDLERNNDYVRQFLRALENNVLGSDGVSMQSKLTKPDGSMDMKSNDAIEEAWYEWGKPKNCTMAGDLSWLDLQRLILRSVARDGAFVLRKYRTDANAFGFALRPMEVDFVSFYTNDESAAPGANTTRMGIEKNAWGKPVAYWLLPKHPGDWYGGGGEYYGTVERVPAEEIIFLYTPDRMGQTAGVPWLISAMTGLQMLGGYQEAELVAARVASCKGGFYTKPGGQEYSGQTNEQGQLTTSIEPGTFETLPTGWDFKTHDPQHPNSNYGAYVKSCLRGIAAGLGVSYTSLSNDLEGVNFSSIRAGLLEEREQWKMLQTWLITHLCEPVFESVIESALLTGALQMPAQRGFEAVRKACWRGRRWAWVDPQSEVTANLAAINGGLTSRTRVTADTGSDLEEIFDELAHEKQLADSEGLVFIAPNLGGSMSSSVPAKTDDKPKANGNGANRIASLIH